MFFDHIHHIAINCSDYRKTKEFYVEKLGFEIIRENKRDDKNDVKLDLKLGNYELELFISPNAPKRPSYPEALGLRHLAFKVENIEEVITFLNAKEIECEAVRTDTFTGERMTFFFDPDGLPLELHE
ncbi:glyoxylase [Enterococcus sp. DIV0840]|uniref:SMU1112c/YaeR family gloxylase I-like metalloprotein n=1 Tax=Enterococcus TaxID=1350 RepID=UPI001A8ECB32|nr:MULTISPECIES: VOC family protein [Enterococcus]MBO0435345.1 VOC family protein [Enterococcus sp. DIV0849a]MBO0473987.1 VOC family protein [Enterococcus ureasiticus]